ncbi:type II secretion system F family protein [Cucumibacter marinus]|uniref:type II secretion system F family protein n=1 Tax=Cucumibacter marinus TaxID=1121252 RepID=UPI00040452EA|nr:type II secretion system F family protein [Cucumibacter marinus]
MSPLVLALLAAVSIGALAFALVPGLVGDSRAEKRKEALKRDNGDLRQAQANLKQRDTRRRTVQQALKTQNEALEKKRKKAGLQQRIYQAGMKIRARSFVRNAVILGLVICVIAWFIEIPLYFVPVFGLAGGYLGPMWFLKRQTRRYQAQFLDELPTAVETIVRGVKSGLPLNDSIKVVAKETREPVKTEFARILDQQSVGKPMSEAIEILYDRVPLPEVNFFVVVIAVQQQAGGNLSEALSNLANVLRARKKMHAKVKAMSSEAKASAMIIGALPFVVAGLVSLVSPGYMAPLISTTLGYLWLGVAAVMMALGIFVMNRMIQFDV